MSLFIELLLSPQVSIVQIIIMAYIGAIIGEMTKEINDDVPIDVRKFLVSWAGSGFSGFLVGMLLQGTIAKDNSFFVLGGSGTAGFMGQKKSLVILERVLNMFIKNAEDKEKNDTKKK